MTISEQQARQIMGQDLIGAGGERIGKVGQVFLDDETGQPEWVTVKTGLFGTRESFVPIAQGQVSGSDLAVPYDKDMIKNAPNVDDEGGHLSPEEEAELYRYYGMDYQLAGQTGTQTSETTTGVGTAGLAAAGTGIAGGVDRDRDNDGIRDDLETRGTTGYDTSGPTTDDAMTRSEERLRVGVQRVETGRARLRKFIVTENVTTTVPVEREEVRVVREPITSANTDAAYSGPALSEEEHEVVLHAERPVVEKEVRAVERVRLDTETVVEQQQVTEQVRKEQIEVETDGVVDVDRGTGTTTGTTTGSGGGGLIDKAKDALGVADTNRDGR